MTDTNALLPCPFCGERAETDFIPEHHSYQVECRDVFGCTARVTRDSALGAVEAWNCRALSPASLPIAARRGADGADALPPELTSIAAVEVATPSEPARDPLAEVQMHEELANAYLTL